MWAVVLNHREGADSLRCLDALAKVRYRSLTRLVVDNASGPGEVAWLRSAGATVVESGGNLGYAGGNNVGHPPGPGGRGGGGVGGEPRCLPEPGQPAAPGASAAPSSRGGDRGASHPGGRGGEPPDPVRRRAHRLGGRRAERVDRPGDGAGAGRRDAVGRLRARGGDARAAPGVRGHRPAARGVVPVLRGDRLLRAGGAGRVEGGGGHRGPGGAPLRRPRRLARRDPRLLLRAQPPAVRAALHRGAVRSPARRSGGVHRLVAPPGAGAQAGVAGALRGVGGAGGRGRPVRGDGAARGVGAG